MTKQLSPLEALKDIKDKADLEFFLPMEEEFNIVETALKALEIIKNKTNFNQANNSNGTKQKCLIMVVLDNDKDFDLLKEELK